jgi:hypothetical protein
VNWDAIGAVAELLAAVGFIVSLIYLAKQISMTNENVVQNTTALFNQGEHASLNGVVAINLSIVESRSVAELMLQAYSDHDSLDAVDRFRFGRLLFTQFESHQTFFLQNSRNSGGKDQWATWEYYARAFDDLLKVPCVAKWWVASRSNFDSGFIAYIDNKLPAQ